MISTDAQVRKLMEEFHKHGKTGLAALRAGLHRQTARKYLANGKLPSELAVPHTWRTRDDPFQQDWPSITARLADAPELEAKALFEELLRQHPDRYQPGHLRTFQRRVRQWRALSGPPKEVFFPQEHRPGEAMQTDFTHATELGVTILGEPLVHLLCHCVLPYSNWEWATVSRSESLCAIRRGVQTALFRLERVPQFHQTDNSTAATHELATGKRGFLKEYKDLMDHFGMAPRTIAIGKSNQNGDVEALNGAFKRRLLQHLLLRGNRDFESVDAYETWLGAALERANAQRQVKVAEELAVMKPLLAARLPEYTEELALVTSWSTIRVKRNTYSVPARLIGETVKVRLYDDRIEVYYANVHQETLPRLLGRMGHRIDYRHVIWSLVQKPWAFERYKYREELFPSPVFRRAYDALCAALPTREAELSYLRLLHQAASTLESEVEAALALLQEQGTLPAPDAVKALLGEPRQEAPKLAAPPVDLSVYDALLSAAREGLS